MVYGILLKIYLINKNCGPDRSRDPDIWSGDWYSPTIVGLRREVGVVIKNMKNFGVYILESQKNYRYYIGSTDNISRRFDDHNFGKVASTRNLRPWIIKVFIVCKDLTEARSNEYRLKKYKRKDILNKVILDKTFPWNY